MAGKVDHSNLRDGDINALRSKAKLEGKPIKSTTIFRGKEHIFYTVDKEGRCHREE